MYEDIYTMCQNVERVMELYSKELMELDRNTVQYMMDEMQDTIDDMQGTIDGMQGTIDGMQGTIDGMQGTIEQQSAQLAEKEQLYQEALKRIAELEK